MNPHTIWLDFLPAWRRLTEFASYHFGRCEDCARPWRFLVFQDTHFTLAHVAGALLVVLLVAFLALRFRASLAGDGEERLVPPPRFSARAFVELFLDAVRKMAENIMGKEAARRTLPLTATLAFFIFFSNVLGLIPGFLPPTDTLKTNFALSVTAFLMYNFYGLRAHGLAYLKHFLGPIWYLAPLMLVIEIISHLARPMSLALRLMGNIAADHKVVAAFFGLVPLLVPLPFLLLGVMVCVVQTLVFTLLTMVYISMAVAHEDHGAHEAGVHEAPAH